MSKVARIARAKAAMAEKAARLEQTAVAAVTVPEMADEMALSPSINLCDMNIVHEIAAGLDVHKETIVASVVGINTPSGSETKTFGTLEKDIKELAIWLLNHEVEVALMESTGVYWTRPFRLLTELGVHVILSNAREIKNVPGRKTDIEDSRWLANIARFNLARPCRVLSQENDELREMSRMRQNIVQEQNRHKNYIIKLLVKSGFNVTQIVTDVFGKTGMIIVRGLLNGETPENILKSVECALGWRLKTPRQKLLDALVGSMSAELRFQLETMLEAISESSERIKAIEARLESALIEKGHGDSLKILETLPGTSRIGAMTVLVELGCDLSDFRSAEALSSWAGMCPGNNESAGKRKSGRTPFGNAHLKRIICELVWAATRTDCYLKDKWNSMKGRLRYKKALVAVGNKMLKIIYYMLTRREPYKDPGVDLKEMMVKRNAPRWIKNLAAYGLL